MLLAHAVDQEVGVMLDEARAGDLEAGHVTGVIKGVMVEPVLPAEAAAAASGSPSCS